MRVAVTGASGHLGANLVRALLEDGHDVTALVRDDVRSLEGLDVRRVRGDLFEPEALRRSLESSEMCFHAAAMIAITSDPTGDVLRINQRGPRAVVDACLATGVRRLVHVSSIHALSAHPAGTPTNESSGPVDAQPGASDYGASKVLGEREILEGLARGLDAVIVNPTAIIGPHDWKPSRMGRFILGVTRGHMPALVAGGFNFVGAGDVARGAIAAGKLGRTGERYLLSGTWRPIAELARQIARSSGAKPPRLVVPTALARIGAPIVETLARWTGASPLYTRESIQHLCEHREIDRGKAERELGYAPRPLDEAIEETLAWFRTQWPG
jgi:dihydroflavonol-4-reductase